MALHVLSVASLNVVLASALLFGNTVSAFAGPPQGESHYTIVMKDGKAIGSREVLPPRTWLGLSPLEISVELREHYGAPRDAGVLVQSVRPHSPALLAGLEVGDVLITIDHQPIDIPWDLGELLREKKPGQTVVVELVRNKVHFNVPVRLDVMPVEMRTIITEVEPVAVVTPPPSVAAKPRPYKSKAEAKLKELNRQLDEIEKELHK